MNERPNYAASKSHNLEIVLQLAPGLIPSRQSLPRLPFRGHTKPGVVYQTLLIEPPVFLAKLEADLRTRCAVFVARKLPAGPTSAPQSRRRSLSTALDWDQ